MNQKGRGAAKIGSREERGRERVSERENGYLNSLIAVRQFLLNLGWSVNVSLEMNSNSKAKNIFIFMQRNFSREIHDKKKFLAIARAVYPTINHESYPKNELKRNGCRWTRWKGSNAMRQQKNTSFDYQEISRNMYFSNFNKKEELKRRKQELSWPHKIVFHAWKTRNEKTGNSRANFSNAKNRYWLKHPLLLLYSSECEKSATR